MSGPEWSNCAVDGVAGAAASAVEVVDADGATRHPLESPIGVFIVCSDARREAIARVIDSDGNLLFEQPFGGVHAEL